MSNEKKAVTAPSVEEAQFGMINAVSLTACLSGGTNHYFTDAELAAHFAQRDFNAFATQGLSAFAASLSSFSSGGTNHYAANTGLVDALLSPTSLDYNSHPSVFAPYYGTGMFGASASTSDLSSVESSSLLRDTYQTTGMFSAPKSNATSKDSAENSPSTPRMGLSNIESVD